MAQDNWTRDDCRSLPAPPLSELYLLSLPGVAGGSASRLSTLTGPSRPSAYRQAKTIFECRAIRCRKGKFLTSRPGHSNAARNSSRAFCQSRRTVRSVRSSTSAISTSLKPPK